MSSVLSVTECIKAGYSSIVIKTSEEDRAIKECLNAGRECEKRVFCWSCIKGIEEILEEPIQKDCIDMGEYYTRTANSDLTDAQDALNDAINLNDGRGDYILILLDFHHYLNRADVLRSAKDAFKQVLGIGACFVFVSNSFDVPSDWEDSIISIELRLPNKDEIKEHLEEMVNLYKDQLKLEDLNQLDELVDKASEIALGLTITQAENAFATSFSKVETIDLHIISEVKAQIICTDGLLEFWNNNKNVEIGGMHTFRDYTKKRLLAFSEKAKEYGLPNPKGVLLVGIPGCGKSLAAKSLAQEWNVPLIKCDLGKLFGSYVGDTESNTRKALKTAEAMSPCVLWIDEIEKGLAGAGSSGSNDSGVSSRMFASILTWMQEKEKPVYVIATANSITSLPQELLRKGRFDEIFFVDLPNQEERKEIIEIQIKKKQREPENFDINEISKRCDGFTGAEIEEMIVSSMFEAYADGERELEDKDILSVIDKTIPASKGFMSQTVSSLQQWAEERGIANANSKIISNEAADANKKGNIGRSRKGRKIMTTGGSTK